MNGEYSCYKQGIKEQGMEINSQTGNKDVFVSISLYSVYFLVLLFSTV